MNSPASDEPAQSVAAPEHSKANVIVGGVIGGVIFLILAIATVVSAKARRSDRFRSMFNRGNKGDTPHRRQMGSIDPFPSPSDLNPPTSSIHNNELQGSHSPLPLMLNLKSHLPPLPIDETTSSQPTEQRDGPHIISSDSGSGDRRRDTFHRDLVMELRGEVVNLRRELEQTRMQVERVTTDQAPPGYYEDGA